MLDLILSCIIGVLCGVVTGLIPGIHVNTAGAFVFSASPFLLYSYSPEVLAVFLLSMSISHALLEFIPSMFLGVPEEECVTNLLVSQTFKYSKGSIYNHDIQTHTSRKR